MKYYVTYLHMCMNYNLLNEWERRNVNKLTQKVLMKKIKIVDQNVAQTLKVCFLTKGCFLKYDVKYRSCKVP